MVEKTNNIDDAEIKYKQALKIKPSHSCDFSRELDDSAF